MGIAVYRLTIKIFLALFCISAHLLSHAQHKFRFFPIKGISLQHSVLAGTIGSRVIVMNQEEIGVLALYVFDTATQAGIAKNYSFPKPLSIFTNDQSLVCMGASAGKSGPVLHLLELDKEGNIIRRKDGPLPMQQGPVQALASANKKFFLFYHKISKAGDSSLIQGTLLGPDWDTQKQLQYGFRYDTELDAEPEIFLDNDGNTHVLVTDMFTNYRISSDLTVNTIPYTEEQIVSETFTFGKVKLKSLRVFQNNECNCMQAEGLYVDGTGKTNKGIYSIAFPLGRKNELAPRFIPFNEFMIKNLRHGFSATDETIQKSIELQEIVYADDGSMAVLWLNAGIPQKIQKFRPENDPSLRSFNRSLSVSRGSDLVLPTTNPVNTLPRVRTISPGDRYANAAPMLGTLPMRQLPLSSRASGRNAPKMIFVQLEKEQGVKWYQSRSLDIFTADYEMYNRSFLIGGEKEEIVLILYQADAVDEPHPVLITLQAGKQFVEKFPKKKLVFSPIQFLTQRQYATLYRDTETGEGGLLVIRDKE